MKRKIGIGIIIAVVACMLLVLPSVIRNTKFNKAVSLIEAEDLSSRQKGVEVFESIKDSKKKKIEEYSSQYIEKLCGDKKFESADDYVKLLKKYEILPGSTLENYSNMITYNSAGDLAKSGKYTDAYYSYIRLADYQDSAEKASDLFDNHQEDFYQLAIENYDKATEYDLQFAKAQFEKLGDYEDTQNYLEKISFMQCMMGTYEKEYSSDHKIVISDFCVTEYYLSSDYKSEMKALPLECDGELYLVAQQDGSQQCIVYKRSDAGLELYQYKGRTSYDGKELVSVKKDDNTAVYKWTSKESEEIKEPKVGMTSEEVKKSTWGEPKKINKTTYSWGTSEQWCYSNYKYIYLDNGIVTAIQE